MFETAWATQESLSSVLHDLKLISTCIQANSAKPENLEEHFLFNAKMSLTWFPQPKSV